MVAKAVQCFQKAVQILFKGSLAFYILPLRHFPSFSISPLKDFYQNCSSGLVVESLGKAKAFKTIFFLTQIKQTLKVKRKLFFSFMIFIHIGLQLFYYYYTTLDFPYQCCQVLFIYVTFIISLECICQSWFSLNSIAAES